MTEVIEDEEESAPMSERVQVLAQGIYDEFQTMVGEYGQECIGNLMPLVVNVLENLDSALADNKDYLTALEETNEENQQLNKQFQKEKQKRKELEEKSMHMEDLHDLELRDLRGKLSDLTLENKNLGSRTQSQKQQIDRLEERSEAVQKENQELHEKQIELFKNFQSQVELIKQNAAAKIAARNKSSEEFSGSPSTPHALGFQDFTSPPKATEAKKKRQLPIAPRGRKLQMSDLEDDETFLATTPFQRAESPEFQQRQAKEEAFDPNYMSLCAEQEALEEEERSDQTLGDEEDPNLEAMMENIQRNDDSLMAELHLATSSANVPGVDQILQENQKLHTEKNELTREMDDLLAKYRETETGRMSAQNSLNALTEEKSKLVIRTSTLEAEVKKLRSELEEEQEKSALSGEGQVIEGPGGLKLTRVEVARVLRERNEYKEKYLSLLEQIRMSDELSLFKSKSKKSRWVDYFAALFSSSKRRQLEQNLSESSPRRPYLSRRSPAVGTDEEDGGFPQAGSAGYRNTGIIPVLKKTGKKQDEVYMTSVSWVIPTRDHHISEDASMHPQSNTPSINTCRPMSYQEDGAKLLCAAAVNLATFVDDCASAISVCKSTNGGPPKKDSDTSISLIWIVTGVPNLTKVSVIDVAAVGDVLDTFPVCASPICCISSVPGFDSKDPDVLASVSRQRPASATSPSSAGAASTTDPSESSDRPSSSEATMWLGSDSGVLYVHSAVSQWKKCIHADKLPAAIVAITHFKGKTFVLMQNSKLAIFRRFPDGEWDWDNYSLMVLTQRRDIPASAMASVKYNIWCAVGNTIHVVQPYHLKMEATFQVHQNKSAVVTGLLNVGAGVWISFKMDSTLRLYNAASFAHMQDLNIAHSIHKILVFGNEKQSQRMPIQVSSMVAAHSSLWVGTENGVLISYPFTTPAVVAEESGWELIKEAEVGGEVVPEPFDVRTEEGLEAGASLMDEKPTGSLNDSRRGSGNQNLSHSATDSSTSGMPPVPRTAEGFNPFCIMDQVELSIHCHINGIRCLLAVPGIVPTDLSVYEPLGGVYIGPGDTAQNKPTLFVVSCGEGHLDLRTADKVLQTLQAKENGSSGLPSPATIISEKNYVMVWDINN